MEPSSRNAMEHAGTGSNKRWQEDPRLHLKTTPIGHPGITRGGTSEAPWYKVVLPHSVHNRSSDEEVVGIFDTWADALDAFATAAAKEPRARLPRPPPTGTTTVTCDDGPVIQGRTRTRGRKNTPATASDDKPPAHDQPTQHPGKAAVGPAVGPAVGAVGAVGPAVGAVGFCADAEGDEQGAVAGDTPPDGPDSPTTSDIIAGVAGFMADNQGWTTLLQAATATVAAHPDPPKAGSCDVYDDPLDARLEDFVSAVASSPVPVTLEAVACTLPLLIKGYTGADVDRAVGHMLWPEVATGMQVAEAMAASLSGQLPRPDLALAAVRLHAFGNSLRGGAEGAGAGGH